MGEEKASGDFGTLFVKMSLLLMCNIKTKLLPCPKVQKIFID